MTRLAFVSGWAGHAAQHPRLAAAGRYLVPFTSHSEADIVATLDADSPEILVGWSTGAHIILKHHARFFGRCERIVLAAPFDSFTRHVDPRALAHMRRGMDRRPQATVETFFDTCGVTTPFRPSFRPEDVPALAAGLDFLRDSVAELPAEVLADNVMLVHGSQDRIVPPAASEALLPCLRGATLLRPHCGHFVAEDTLADLLHEAAHLRLF